MASPTISIIVPIYKVEKYLSKCVDSILSQTYSDFELILVDDGSPDNCPKICDEYALKDSRIKVIHKENGGLSDARNVGMGIAKGEYLAFVDSDDYISKDIYQTLIDNAISEDADIVVCDASLVNEGEEPTFTSGDKKVVMDKDKALLQMIKNRLFTVNAWNKLYKRELFSEITYPKGMLYEDLATTYKLLDKSKKVVYINAKLYAYLQRKSSIMGQSGYKMKADKVEIVDEMINYFKDRNAFSELMVGMINYLLNDIYKMASSGNLVSSKEYLNELKVLYEKYKKQIKSNDKISKKSKKILKLAVKHPKLLQFLYSKVRRG